MIKAKGQMRDGTPVILLGLSGENMTRLMTDEPIMFDLVELGLPSTQVIIIGGRTEDTILAELRKHVPVIEGES